ncbi:MAG TPA: SURF1 family protein [Burkholderiales bacterium]|nr:SURF1 family protein [Burkholderiales bacterium]
MPRGYSFRPRLWALALAAAACAAGIALGNWQSRRADEKRALAEHLQRIVVTGEFLPERTVLLDNKLRGGRAGYEVVAPLRLAEGIHVLVNRGWIAAPPRRDQLPQVVTPPGRLRVEGVVLSHLPRTLKLGDPEKGPVRQSVELKEFAAETGLTLQAFVIQQHSDTGDGLARDWPPPDAGIEKHQAYSFQWYSLAALAVVLGLVLSFRRK